MLAVIKRMLCATDSEADRYQNFELVSGNEVIAEMLTKLLTTVRKRPITVIEIIKVIVINFLS